jgi:DNA-binding NarL/FixJ family response regulator
MGECGAERSEFSANVNGNRGGPSPGTSGSVYHRLGGGSVGDSTAMSNGVPGSGMALRDMSLLIVDDCALHCQTLTKMFMSSGLPAPSVAADLPSLIAALNESAPHVVLINFEARDSATLLRVTSQISPRTKVVVLGMSEDDEAGIVACAEAGVAGYHLRTESLDDLLALVRRVADGEALCSPRVSAILLRRLSTLAAQRQSIDQGLALTAREVQILRMVEVGLSNRDIAEQLSIAVHTVKSHVHSLLTKLGASSRADAVTRLRSLGTNEIDRQD